MPTLSGVIRDSSNALATKVVRAYRRSTGLPVGGTISDPTTGAYSIYTPYSDAHFVLAHDVSTGDPLWGYTSLLMNFDGANNSTTFTDELGSTVTRTGTATVISTAQSKFGDASCYFAGTTGNYLSVASSGALAIETGDFTVEMWIYPSVAFTRTHRLLAKYAGTSSGFSMAINSTGKPFFALAAGSYQTAIATSSLPVGAWTHVAATKIGSTLRLFVAGALEATITIAGTPAVGSYAMTIGYDGLDTANVFNGYIDGFRVTKGFARYGDTFTPDNYAPGTGVSGGTENAIILDSVVPV